MAKKYNKTQQEDKDAQQPAPVVAQPHYKVGNPYQIAGIWYSLNGTCAMIRPVFASWYGDQFAGKLTANGEILTRNLCLLHAKTLPDAVCCPGDQSG